MSHTLLNRWMDSWTLWQQDEQSGSRINYFMKQEDVESGNPGWAPSESIATTFNILTCLSSIICASKLSQFRCFWMNTSGSAIPVFARMIAQSCSGAWTRIMKLAQWKTKVWYLYNRSHEQRANRHLDLRILITDFRWDLQGLNLEAARVSCLDLPEAWDSVSTAPTFQGHEEMVIDRSRTFLVTVIQIEWYDSTDGICENTREFWQKDQRENTKRRKRTRCSSELREDPWQYPTLIRSPR